MINPDLPIYFLSGMSRKEGLFDRLLPLLPNAQVVDWIDPRGRESIRDYAARLATKIPNRNCYIAGVSFGGMVAQELAHHIQPRGCFVISSIRHPRQLPPAFRAARMIGGGNAERLMSMIATAAMAMPKSLRSPSTMRATKFSAQDGAWYRWATSAVLAWQPTDQPPAYPICQIHGDLDTTFPIRHLKPDVVIPGGGHTLPLTHANQVARAILDFIEDKSKEARL